jgi:hypothetical protein
MDGRGVLSLVLAGNEALSLSLPRIDASPSFWLPMKESRRLEFAKRSA